MDAHPVTKKLWLKQDCDRSENWLRAQIVGNPSVLGLGELIYVDSERRQSGGGRLDLLLERPGDRSRYVVELQLGETNPSHIIRAIEYWDREKRKSPKRRHTAVLVAEEITTRFFNVVQLLGSAVPMIGIQVKMVQIGEATALNFTKIIDTSLDDEDGEEGPEVSEKDWRDKFPAAYECAAWYKDLLTNKGLTPQVRFSKGYITIYLDQRVRVSVPAKKNNPARIYIHKLGEQDLVDAEAKFNSERTLFARNDVNDLVFSGNVNELNQTRSAHEWIAQRFVTGD